MDKSPISPTLQTPASQNPSLTPANNIPPAIDNSRSNPTKSKSKRKFVIIGIVVVALLLIVGSSFAAYQLVKKPQKQIVACTQEIKICPDGSSVARTGSSCSFAACPTPKKPQKTIPLMNTSQPDPDMPGWNIYSMPTYNFSFRYPSDWKIDSSSTDNDIIFDSPDFDRTYDFAGFGIINKGNSISISVSKPPMDESTIDEVFSDDSLNKEIAQNKDKIVIDNIPAIQFDSLFESLSQTTTEFLKDGNLYEITIAYPNSAKWRTTNWDVYQKVLASVTFTSPTPVSTAGWKTYTNTQYGFELKYPANLKESNQTQTYTADMQNHVIFSLADTSHAFDFNTTLGVYKNSDNLSANNFIKTYFNNGNVDADNNPIDPNLQKVTFVEKTYNSNTVTFVNGLRTVRGTMGPAAIISKDNNTFFFVSESSSEDETQTFNQILSTFKFTNTQTITPSPTSSQKIPCTTNIDCPSGDTCTVWGPIRVDGPPNKYCTAPGQAVPL